MNAARKSGPAPIISDGLFLAECIGRSHGPLADRLGISLTVVKRRCKRLQALGLLHYIFADEGRGGRRAKRWFRVPQ